MDKRIIPQSHVGLLYEDGIFRRTLPPGQHDVGKAFFSSQIREIEIVDMREQSLTIRDQEILTRDKVALRVSILVHYKVTDPAVAMHSVVSYRDRIYEDVQLAVRRFLASRSFDEILQDRNEISDAVREDVKHSAAGYGVEIARADVKDLIFPGNLREIMNKVLETERQSEAQLIQARKEAEAAEIRIKAEQERVKLRLAIESVEAEALAKNPWLWKLRKLKALAEMANHGGKFVIGLDSIDLKDIIKQETSDN